MEIGIVNANINHSLYILQSLEIINIRMNILVLLDGSYKEELTLRYALYRALPERDTVFILTVFSEGVLYYYDAVPKVKDLLRRDIKSHIDRATKIVREEGKGINAYVLEEEGDIYKVLERVTKREAIDIIYAPPSYKAIVNSRINCPIAIIPGTILVPLDHEELPEGSVDLLATEAKMSSSSIHLLGIVPIHIYSANEREELEEITKKTTANVKSIGKRLTRAHIQCREALCAGFPDEEIIKTFKELSASIILFPQGHDRPSELNKAFNILADEIDGLRVPIFSLQGTIGDLRFSMRSTH